jgi:tripartite-type tricarboxylate transporter receptor subunit TctC
MRRRRALLTLASLAFSSLAFALQAVVSATLLLWFPSPAQAQAPPWPQRPVRFILPLGPGSATDIAARLFAERLAQRWGQPVVVENRPGGDSFVAITAFLGANDDHALLFAGMGTFTAHPYLHEKLPYDRRDIVPVAGASNIVVAIAVPSALPARSLAELVALARAQPGKLNVTAVPGITDFMFSGFLQGAGVSMARVPYRDITQGLGDLAEGRIQVMSASLAILQPQLTAGRIRLLAVTSRARVPIAPEVPTVTEAGFPLLELEGLVGLYGARAMSNDQRERIAADLRAVAADPVIATRLAPLGQVVNATTPAEYEVAIEDQRAKVAAIAQALGIKAAQ